MKPLFFFILTFVQAFTSLTVLAQFPKPGHDGYREYYLSSLEALIEVSNKRNKFVEYGVGKDAILNDPTGNISTDISTYYFDGEKYFYNGRYYYSTYKLGRKYRYTILLYDAGIRLYVESKYNDAEFKKCKKMLDKQADLVKGDGYYYPDDN